MSENTKLDPATLSAEERAKLKDFLAKVEAEVIRASAKFGKFNSTHEGYAVLLEEVDELWDEIKSNNGTSAAAFNEAVQVSAMGARYALDLFGTATEKAVCPNCGQPTEESPDRPLFSDHLCQYPCQPAQPEPAVVRQSTTDASEPPKSKTRTMGNCKPEPAAPEMPEAVQLALDSLRSSSQRDEEDGEPIRADILRRRAGDLESWWRTHSQPAAVGMTEEPEARMAMAKAGVEKSNDRYFYASREWKMGFCVGWIDGNDYAVRQQAAQGKPKVELPKVPVFEIRWASQFLRTGTNHRTPLKSGYADAIDAWLAELDAVEGRK